VVVVVVAVVDGCCLYCLFFVLRALLFAGVKHVV